jgi:OmcA/MtrC family decaheme c-type cytochrome
MLMWKKYRKIASLSPLLILVCAFGVAAMVGGSGNLYTRLQRAFYLSPAEQVFIRPGLNLQINSVTIPADLHPVATYTITDDNGLPLDKDGVLTPGVVASSFIMAYIPQNASQYVDYSTRPDKDPATGVTTQQAATDSGGTYTSLGNGVYTYRFGTVLPSGYDTTATHTLGIYATRDLRPYGLSLYVSNQTLDFVPNGSPVTKIRQVVVTSACNQCHDPLSAHGETGRERTEICILCHTPQTTDTETGNTVDFKVMIHKIHMGSSLPSVQAGKPYTIVGFQNSVNDFSDVVFPQDIRNCTTCHQNSLQVNDWLLNPTMASCGSCHDNIDWATGANHPGGPQLDNKFCANCHYPQGEFEYDASIAGAHIPPYKSQQLIHPKFKILSITNTGPGQNPTVQFTITDKNNNSINPSTMGGSTGRLAATIAGPTSDYRYYVQESANTATYSNGVASYTFKAPIPATATGSYSVELEGYVNTTINPGTTIAMVYRDAADNVVQSFSVTGPVVPRKTVVLLANCDKCHDKLQLHGNNRNQIEACVMCHNPATTDSSQRPASANPPATIDFKIMIHRIHTGVNLSQDYTIYGFGGSVNNFNDVLYPGDRRDCIKCHDDTTYTVPLPSSVTPSTTPRNFWNPTLPTAAACMGCHDSLSDLVHFFVNTASFGESCATCHSEEDAFAVSAVHAR